MGARLLDTLWEWKSDPDIRAVIIDAVPGRAFCAGADVHCSCRMGPKRSDPRAMAFFITEYRLNAAMAEIPETLYRADRRHGYGWRRGAFDSRFPSFGEREPARYSSPCAETVCIGLYPGHRSKLFHAYAAPGAASAYVSRADRCPVERCGYGVCRLGDALSSSAGVSRVYRKACARNLNRGDMRVYS